MLTLRGDHGGETPDVPSENPAEQDRVLSERAICCAACGATVTSPRHRISVQGSHEHRFMNPGGFLFHFGCFAEAIGCKILGPDSNEYAWFPGFAWRFALCGSCGQHLGWHFRSDGKDGFFGLVLDRLREPSSDA
jgi:hypothetical protein